MGSARPWSVVLGSWSVLWSRVLGPRSGRCHVRGTAADPRSQDSRGPGTKDGSYTETKLLSIQFGAISPVTGTRSLGNSGSFVSITIEPFTGPVFSNPGLRATVTCQRSPSGPRSA